MARPRSRIGNTPQAALTLTTKQVNAVAVTVAAKLKEHEEARRFTEQDTAQNLFTMFMHRFDKVDQDNTAIKKTIDDHILVDSAAYKVLDRHSTYWGLTIKSLLGLIGAGFATFLAWLGLK